AIDIWTAEFATHAPGGGENLSAMLDRVQLALQAAQQLCVAQAVQDVVWISHAGVARCVNWLQAQGAGVKPQPHRWPTAAPAWGEWEIRNLNGESVSS
ncbi:MAG: phosphoglycerate kinase, partial [Gammaproteobacteria bacterium]|nr:phosphoglycerate kinase [Gammaproteobacteria bacterium]